MSQRLLTTATDFITKITLTFLLTLFLLTLLLLVHPTQTWAIPPSTPPTQSSSPSTLFTSNCAGCHLNGGNIIRRGKNLKLKTLEKNGYGTIAAIADIITHGKGNMSAYGDRLNPEEIEAIAAYVLEQAQNSWK